jgi:hypothetical protein
MPLNLSFSTPNATTGNTISSNKATRKWIGRYSKGVFWNFIPWLMKLSMMLRMLRIRNMMPAKLMNPRNLWMGDYPLSIEMCLTLLGTNDKQLLYFLYWSTTSLISLMSCWEDRIVKRGMGSSSPSLLTGGKK